MMDFREAEDNSVVSTKIAWNTLTEWVKKNHGGEIHEALTLEERDSTSRGVFATRHIVKGETLIRLPPSCVLSGASIIQKAGARAASSWLKCVGGFYKGMMDDKWQPYLNSLPKEYETLFRWTNDQIAEFLAGTALGEIALADRNDDSLRKRYETAVRPFLADNLGLSVGSVDLKETSAAEMQRFLEVCTCISTRGFHLSTCSDIMDAGDYQVEYGGPFLLPVIDLLNHDPSRKCTTLQRDATTGAFYMTAENDIKEGQEILHSYGDSLTAAQLLHTFGFVPSRLESYRLDPLQHAHLTPVVLQKHKHLLAACEAVKASIYPKSIRDFMETSISEGGDGEVWEVEAILNRPLSDHDAPDDWLISRDSGQALSDELITFVVLQFLPEEALEEILGSDGRILAWLDRSILEDAYLGCLVFKALLQTMELKKTDYVPLTGSNESLDTLQGDIVMLEELENAEIKDLTTLRKVWGLSVRVEEQLSLKALEDEIKCLMQSLKVDVEFPPPAKRSKTDS